MNGLRALVVDDDPLVRMALKQLYETWGISVEATATAREFFDGLARETPDVCIVDMVLPDGNGVAIIEQLRSRSELRRTAMIGVTGRVDPKILVTAFNAGADDFLFKPVSGEELLVRTRLAIQRRRENGGGSANRSSERRDLTTLFCDVRGFTQVAATLDPEWVVEVLNGLFERLCAHVNARGGTVDKFLGDGLLAFFGANGHSGKEVAAIQSAFAMIETAKDYARDSLVLKGRPLNVGVGIATGEVVIAGVGSASQRQLTVIGDAVNLASRLQSIAEGGEVLICERTFERVRGVADTAGGRRVELKGIAGVPTVYPVTSLRPEAWLA